MENVIRFGENFIEMEFQPDWSKVKSLWNLLRSVIQLILYDSNKSDLISMAGIELVENAVKYTMFNKLDDTKVIFRLDSYLLQRKVKLKVTNKALIEDIEEIKNSIERLRVAENRRKLYLNKLMEASKADVEEETMELGIMRVMVEANADVNIESDEDGKISIIAIFNVNRKYN